MTADSEAAAGLRALLDLRGFGGYGGADEPPPPSLPPGGGPPIGGDPVEPPAEPGSEDQIAELLVNAMNGDWRFVAGWNQWLHWDGARWCDDELLEIFERARRQCRWTGLAAKSAGATAGRVRT